MSSGGRPSLRLTGTVVVAVLLVCGLAAWLVFDVGCGNFPDFFLFRPFCDKEMLAVAGPALGAAAVLIVLAAVAQRRERR
jgi:hypothetical protein